MLYSMKLPPRAHLVPLTDPCFVISNIDGNPKGEVRETVEGFGHLWFFETDEVRVFEDPFSAVRHCVRQSMMHHPVDL